MKKVIALSCSPSRGRNSDTMLDHFLSGVSSVPGVSAEKIYLSDIYIDYYKYENSKGVMEDEKDFAELTDKIKKYSNGLVIATPTYNFSVPAHLKNFIDRLRFIALDMSRKNSIGQPVGMLGHLNCYFLVSGGTPTWAQKILFFTFPPFWLRGVFLYFGANVMGAYYTGDIKAYLNEKVLQGCHDRGVKYAKDLVAGKRNKILERIFWRPPQTEAYKDKNDNL